MGWYFQSHQLVLPCLDEDDFTPLMHACFNHRTNIVKWFMEELKKDGGCITNDIVNQQNQFRVSALMVASYHGHDDIVEILTENKVDLDAQNIHGEAALHVAIAIDENNQKMYEWFNAKQIDLDHSKPLDLNKKSKDSSIRKNAETVSLLVKNGANVNLYNYMGKSPFLIACSIGSLDIAQCLKNAGAHISIENVDIFNSIIV